MNSTNTSNSDTNLSMEISPLSMIMRFLGSIVLIENSFAIVILSRSKLLPNNIRSLSTSLVCTDLIAGLLTLIPTSTFKSFLICKIQVILVTAVVMTSFLNVTAISMDMTASLLFPFKHRTMSTSLLYRVVCLSLWLFGLLQGTLLFYRRQTNDQCDAPFSKTIQMQKQTLLLFMLFIWNIILYGYISVSIRKKRIAINDADVKHRLKNLRQTLKLTVIVMTFIVCYLPHTVLNVLLLTLDGEHFENVLKYRRIGFVGIILNCALDPILFVFRFRICKRQAVRLLCCFSEKALKKTSVSENSNQIRKNNLILSISFRKRTMNSYGYILSRTRTIFLVH